MIDKLIKLVEAITKAQTDEEQKRLEAELLAAVTRVRIHNQNKTTAARAQADRKTFGHLS